MYAFEGWDLDDIQLQKPSGRHLFWGQLMKIHCYTAVVPALGYCHIIANYWQFKCRLLHAFAVVRKG
jgi:hypothetical protein